jgi:hypothetical protein
LVGNGNAHAPDAHKTKYTVGLQDVYTSPFVTTNSNEYIGCEQRNLNLAFAVAPPMNFGKERKKSLYAILFQLRSNSLFMPGFGLDSKPGMILS